MKKRDRYIDIKKMLNVYYETAVEAEVLEKNFSVKRNSIREIIRILNKSNLLNKISNTNKLKDDLYNKTIFDNKDNNLTFLASLMYAEEENSEKIINYMFKTSVDNMLFSIANKYSLNFHQNIKKLLDEKIYNQIILIIKENKKENIEKIVCKITFISTIKVETIIPLELFIFNDSSFICAHSLDKKEFTFIDTKDIDDVITSSSKYSKYINFRGIEKYIKNYIISENNKNEEFVMIRLTPETLSLLLDFSLLLENKYEIFEDDTKNSNRLNFIDQSTLNKKLSENKIKDEIIFDKKISFYQEDTKKYIVKTKLTKHKLNFIINHFNNVEIIKVEG